MSRWQFPAVAMAARAVAVVAALALAMAACGTGTPSPAPPASGAGTATSSPAATPAGPEAVVVDTDLSFDDILALAFLLRQPEVDVKAVTVVGTGLVHCLPGLQVMARLLATLGRSDVPVSCGREEPLPGGHSLPADWRELADSAYGLNLELASASNPPSAAPELLASVAGAAAAPITVVALGPLTNLADALEADPALASRIARVVEMGGAVDVAGNVSSDPSGIGTPGPAEWNIYADPAAADAVFRSRIPITLVPLDATNAVPVDQAFVDALGSDHAAAGADIAYELVARRGVNGYDYLWDALAAVVAVDESVVTFETVPLKVVTAEGPDSGRTVRAAEGVPVRVAKTADRAAFEERFLAGLRLGAPRPHPFTLAGTIEVAFDGTSCADQRPPTVTTGAWKLDGSSSVEGTTVFVVVKFHEGAGWKDLLDYRQTAKDPTNQPDFVDVTTLTYVDKPGSATAIAGFTPGRYGVVCLYGTGGNVNQLFPGSGEFTVNATP